MYLPADRHALVLLSDGLENEGDYWAKNNSACGTPPVKNSFDAATGSASDVRIDTVAFGADADQVIVLWREKTTAKEGAQEAFKPKMLVRVDASRYKAGGETMLYFHGATGEIRELSLME